MALNLAKGIIFPCKPIFSDSPIKYQVYLFIAKRRNLECSGFSTGVVYFNVSMLTFRRPWFIKYPK